MKKSILFIVLFVFIGCKSAKENPNEIVITSKKEVVANGYTFSIDKIISDSRCPEGVNCIWAGELVLNLIVWKNNQSKESNTITFSPLNEEANKQWFSKYIPENKKLREINITPAKTDKSLELKDFKIELILE